MLIQIKVQILTKKSHFKTFVYVSYDMYNFMIRYDSYDTHTVSYDSWTLMICRYDTKLFTHDSIRIVRYVSCIVRYWQLWVDLFYFVNFIWIWTSRNFLFIYNSMVGDRGIERIWTLDVSIGNTRRYQFQLSYKTLETWNY